MGAHGWQFGGSCQNARGLFDCKDGLQCVSRSQSPNQIRTFIGIMLLSLEELFYYSMRIKCIKIFCYNIEEFNSFIGSFRLKIVFKNFHLKFNFKCLILIKYILKSFCETDKLKLVK